MAVVTMRQLLESGVHFGHQTRRWNPKMKRFIFTERNGIYIIDLQQSLTYIDTAYAYVRDVVAKGGTILFVGTKKQAQEAIEEQATRVGMPFVNQRWLGGMLTNFQTVHGRLRRLAELEELDFDDVAASGRTKKELLGLRREKEKLERTLGGIRRMSKVPNAIWIVDTKKEHLAIDEAKKLGIPIVGVLDTNCDPDEVNFPIPGNDDAIRSVALLTRVIADAAADGLLSRAGAYDAAADGSGDVAGDEPLAEWERELLAGDSGVETPVETVTDAAVAAEVAADEPSAAEAAPSVDGEAVEEPAAEVAADEPSAAEAAPSVDGEAVEEPAAEADVPAAGVETPGVETEVTSELEAPVSETVGAAEVTEATDAAAEPAAEPVAAEPAAEPVAAAAE